MADLDKFSEAYEAALRQYFRQEEDKALFVVSEIGKDMVQARLGPDLLLDLHSKALQKIINETPQILGSPAVAAMEVLLNGMMAYAMNYHALLEAVQAEEERLIEINRRLEREIIDRKRAEDEVRKLNIELALKNRDLEALAKMRAEFLSTASHDLRAPLTGVLGFAELILRGKAGTMNETQERYIKGIYQSGKDLLTIIEDFLELSRIDIKKVQINLQEFDLSEGIVRSLSSMESLFGSKKIETVVQMEENLPRIIADPNRFNQMLTNYLSNALKFTSEGGKVSIIASREGEQVKVMVQDTGIGISKEDQKHLFEKFYQVEATRYSYKGTGLGLSIVKALAELQKGSVGVESAPGKGSSFWFTLPVFKKETK